MSRPRISRGRLEELCTKLSERDLDILTSLATSRFLTSNQMRRMHFADHATNTAAIRSSNRTLARLAALELVCHLDRRVGGVRAGSASNVWSLSEIGGRLLHHSAGFDQLPKRLRTHEPTTTFLEHTLAVAEVCVRLAEAARGGDFAILELQREPDCWRAYSGPEGGVATLKPDLSLVTACGDFEDHWFLEIDRDTEPPSRIVRACMRYEAYRQTSTEQKRLGVFPAVLWIVPHPKRAVVLKTRLSTTPGLSRSLFEVVAIDELPSLVRAGFGSREIDHES
jgi:hypothetical protein